MKALSVISVLLLACSLSLAETRQPYPVLIVNAGNVSLGAYPPSGDSVIVSVYMENVTHDVGEVNVWLSLGHDEVFKWDAVAPLGTAIEDWEITEANVIGLQLHVFADGNIVGGTPIPPGVGQHLLMRLIAKVRADRLDPDGTVVDSMCDSPYYELYGVTPVYIDSVLFWTGGGEPIGWVWGLFCTDSICTEWDGETCIAWECTEWDSVSVCDSTAVYLYGGAITLDCEECDLIIGDADASEMIDIDDVVYLVDYIFTSGPSPTPDRVASGDANCDCAVDIDDVVYLIAYILTGGPPPCTCEEWVATCGPLH